MRELPMFPLGSVLLPNMVLPLHVFEPRYRTLMQHVLATDGEFGVVLIARGQEVGGDDLRTDLGTVAKVLQAEEVDDGRWLTLTIGTERIRVERWLPDDPYPKAQVVALEEDHDDEEVMAHAAALAPRVRRVLALQAELGEEGVPPDFALTDDPEVACWQAAVMTPLTPYDAQQVLAIDRCTERLRLMDELLEELEATLRFRLTDEV